MFRTWAIRGIVIVGIVGGVSALGYLSNVVSSGRCEDAVARRVASELGQREVFVLGDEGTARPAEYPGSTAILKQAGFTVRECRAGASPGSCLPWAGVTQARSVGPFVIEVRWAFMRAGHSGRGTLTRYFAFFGWTFALREVRLWVA